MIVQITIGWILLIFCGALYVGQIISSINFSLAQRLGIQEKADIADPLLQRSERYVAYWDLVTLGWLPLAGVLMIVNYEWWSIVSLIGGSIYLDTSGREAAKYLSFRHEGLQAGTDKQKIIFFSTYIIMAVIALAIIIYSVTALLS